MKINCCQIPVKDFKEIFGEENWWNDTEGIRCIPTNKINDSEWDFFSKNIITTILMFIFQQLPQNSLFLMKTIEHYICYLLLLLVILISVSYDGIKYNLTRLWNWFKM